MSRYYVLTERNGLQIVEATAVDETDPFTLRFLGSASLASFDRHDLLWWSSAESAAPAPFSNFGRPHGAQSFRGHAHVGAHFQPFASREPKHSTDYSRCASTVMRVLVSEVAARIPRAWKTALLEIKVSYELPAGRYRLAHRLRDAATGAEQMDFSDALFAAIEVFHRIEVESGQNWNQSVLTLRLDESGRCEAEIVRQHGTNFGSR